MKLQQKIIANKICRLHGGMAPRVLDLFAGCGGLSLGFSLAGCSLIGGVEIDPLAARSHAQNLFKHLPDESLAQHSKPRDITQTSPEQLFEEYGIDDSVESAVDFVIGGPPCQAYSIVGRAKLRDIKKDENAYLNDNRANLYTDYLKFVKALCPLVILIENVPEILRYGKRNIPAEIACSLHDLGYEIRYTLLNSVFYGVPQLRDRMFLVAYAKELDIIPEFPAPTHYHMLPSGYYNMRNYVDRKHKEVNYDAGKFYVSPPDNRTYGKPSVTAKEAIGDLPPIRLHREGKLRRGVRRFTELIPYDLTRPISRYALFMKSWPGLESEKGVFDHVIRYLPRDWEIFARMQENDEYPQAHRVALKLFEERLEEARSKGIDVEMGSLAYENILKSTVPPYDPSKFANKWRKMASNEPVRTITAHIGKDSYSHIHYCSEERRTISVREAARLQSFPDGFIFSGTLDPALKQIGNSVPPLLAHAVAKKIMKQLKCPT